MKVTNIKCHVKTFLVKGHTFINQEQVLESTLQREPLQSMQSFLYYIKSTLFPGRSGAVKFYLWILNTFLSRGFSDPM